jgi:3-phenylpropionate/trans-cinnamate dioxygenase ferredoxin subunit
MAKYVVATVGEIAPGERKIVDVAGRSIGVFNVNGEFFALRNRCPHQGGPLCSGRLAGVLEPGLPGEYRYSRAGELLRCPWHGWEFDVRTGQSWFDPARTRVRSYEVNVTPGAVLTEEASASTTGLQKGPYVAETYAVSVEEQYLVIEVGT